jgi:hypothetical protein
LPDVVPLRDKTSPLRTRLCTSRQRQQSSRILPSSSTPERLLLWAAPFAFQPECGLLHVIAVWSLPGSGIPTCISLGLNGPEPTQIPAAKLNHDMQAMLTHSGFTSVVDTASDPSNTVALCRRIESGEALGVALLIIIWHILVRIIWHTIVPGVPSLIPRSD